MATFTELLARLGPSPQDKGDQFERICQWYLRHDPKYRAELEDVWLWDEWPERDGRDLGIDLVARTRDGKLWAIQAKAYDPEKTLRKSDVDSFLANSARSDFAFRLILTTCRDLTDNLRKQFTQVEPRVSAQVLSDLESAGLIWPDSPEKLRAPKPEKKTPREHQAEAIRAVLKGFRKHDRGRLVMACGTGKTLVGLWVAEKLKAERTLVLLPSLSLLGQTMEEWLANGKRSPEVLAVCSDKTVRGDTDAWVSDTSELGIPVTTDPEEIAAFLERAGPRLIFSTYQSSPQIADAQKLTHAAFDLVVADEAHRCAGRVSGAFATILKAEEIRADRRLFMTATPRYFTGQAKTTASLWEHQLASMDDEKDFGPEFHKLTFGSAIDQDLLSPYRVVIIAVDDPTYKEYAEQRRFVTRDGETITDAKTLATHIALAKAMKKYDLRRMITFHGSIRKARVFAEDLPHVVEWMPEDERPDGDIWCDHVSGKMRTSQRKARLDRLREVDGSGRGLLANARCLGEGVDVPTLDGVAFVDPRRSQVDIVQNVGRAIRKADEKTVGTIVLPVLIDSSEDPEAAVEGSAFRPVWDVLRALRDHDDDLGQWIDRLRKQRDWDGEANEWPDHIAFDVDVRFSEVIRTHALDRIAARPLLTEERILEAADTHFDKTGEWPIQNTGPVVGMRGDNWHRIDAALARGLRGLPGGSSLARLLKESRGVRNKADLEIFDVEQILSWADAYHQRTGRWPTVRSGNIPEAPGETWNRVQSALSAGHRSLPGDQSLAKILAEYRGYAHNRNRTRLTEETVLMWADSHRERTGEWPTTASGPVAEDDSEDWSAISQAMRVGVRGFPGGSSLAEFLADRRGARNIHNLPDLEVSQILEWADSHRARTGRWPTLSSGKVEDAPGETWTAINAALRLGIRGLPGGSSLAILLDDTGRKRNTKNLPDLTTPRILEWADVYYAEHGAWPTRKSGPIAGTNGETWRNVDASLKRGGRGLESGSSLSKLLTAGRGKRSHMHPPPLTEETILQWADEYRLRTGRWPSSPSGAIPETNGETWVAINAALSRGIRGLPGGSSLARLLAERRNKRNPVSLPPLTVELILQWADIYRERNGRWPTEGSGEIPESGGETWNSVTSALRAGRRGLEGGSSLARLLAARRGARNPANATELSVGQILEWADAHRSQCGKWPSTKSGSVLGEDDENWAAINAALRNGNRGLPGGSSLAKLLDEHRRKKKD